MNLQSLLSDWVGRRDDKSFVYQDNSNRLDWEINTGEAKVNFILDSKLNPIDFLKQAYRYCSIQVRSILNGKNIPLSFSATDSYTDSSKIVISTEVADFKKYFLPERLDVMMGLTIHECAHILYTNFYLKTKSKLHHNILNVIEDERIERLIGKNFPGYASYLAKVKLYYFDHKYTEKKIDTEAKQILDLFFKFVRFPKYIDLDLAQEHVDVLVSIKSILTPYPLEFRQAYDAAEKIADLLVQEFAVDKNAGDDKDDKSDPSDKSQSKGNSDSSSDSSSDTDKKEKSESGKKAGDHSKDSSSDSGDDSGNDSTDEDTSKEDSDESGKSSEVQEGQDGEAGKSSESEADKADRETAEKVMADLQEKWDALSDKEKDKARQALEDASELVSDLTSPNEGNPEHPAQEAKELNKKSENKHLIYGDGFVGPSGKSFFYQAKDDKSTYSLSRAKIMASARSLANILSIDQGVRNITHFGMPSGSLDSSKLVDAYLGRPNIYTQKSEISAKGIHVALLIDQSGSMNTKFDSGTRIDVAREVAILFNEAIKQVKGITFYCYGFTSDMPNHYYKNSLYVYNEPGYKKDHALGSITHFSANHDGEAIRETVARIRKFTNEPVLFFVISDGQPNGYSYSGKPAIDDTRKAVVEAEKQRFLPIQIGIDVNTTIQAMMFDRYVNYHDSDTMVRELQIMLRNNVKKLRMAC